MFTNKRSLGVLRIQEKAKPRSPDMIGTITLTRDLVRKLNDQLGENDEVFANLAGWKNHDGDEPYLTVEVSLRYSRYNRSDSSNTIFDEIDHRRSPNVQ